MAEAVVALRRCPTYARDDVQRAVDELFARCGGIESIIRPGMRVLVKVNLLMKRTPERATTTHPEIARAVICAVQRAGGVPILADSPGGPYTRAMLGGIYTASGMREVAQETGCALNDDFSTTTRYAESARVARHLDLIGIADQVDAVITVGKLKTHGLTTMTGCVKNLFGMVPGTAKVEYHARYPKVEMFSDMLVDLCEAVKPCFAVLDGIEAMEGEGPSGGRPRAVGALLGSVNPHAVDAVAAQIIGLKPEQVTTLDAAMRRGLLPEIRVCGDALASVAVSGFDIPMRRKGWVHLVDRLPQALRPRPVFRHIACDGCGTCLRACPAKAISMNAPHRPQVDVKKCIRCYCCQELCPKTDVEVRRNPLFALLK